MVYGKEDAYDSSCEPTNEELDFEDAKNKTNQGEIAKERDTLEHHPHRNGHGNRNLMA